MTKTVEIYVIDQTKTGAAIKCSMRDDGSHPFFLPKSQIKPYGTVRKNSAQRFDIPDWLYLQHWQLCGREAFDEEKKRLQEYGMKRA